MAKSKVIRLPPRPSFNWRAVRNLAESLASAGGAYRMVRSLIGSKRKGPPQPGGTRMRFIKRHKGAYKSNFGAKRKRATAARNYMLKRLKTLERKSKVGKGTHTNLNCSSTQLSSGIRATSLTSHDANHDMTGLEAIIAQLRFYDPNTNTFVTRNPSSLTASQSLAIKQTGTIVGKNAGTTPMVVHCYLVSVRKSNDTAPETAFTQGLADQNNPDATSTLVFPDMSRQFNEYWKIDKHVVKTLKAGAAFYMPCETRWFNYNPAVADAEPNVYSTDVYKQMWLVRVHGTIAHPNNATYYTQVTRIEGSLDIEIRRKTVVYYEAGADLKDFSITDSRVIAPGAGVLVTGASPIPDNVSFNRI